MEKTKKQYHFVTSFGSEEKIFESTHYADSLPEAIQEVFNNFTDTAKQRLTSIAVYEAKD